MNEKVDFKEIFNILTNNSWYRTKEINRKLSTFAHLLSKSSFSSRANQAFKLLV